MTSSQTPPTRKRVAVIGGGPAGLAFLRVFKESGLDWEVTLFEARDSIGGVWYQGDDARPDAGRGKLPASPIYDSLTTNLPVNVMAYHEYMFPPGTPLFPKAAVIRRYLVDFANHFDLQSFIRLNSRVEEAIWRDGTWDVRLVGEQEPRRFDHLVVANGHYQKPYVPEFLGLNEWAAISGRDVMHSTWYREPSPYSGKKVLVIGGGPSGKDISTDISSVAAETFHSVRGSLRNDEGNPKQRSGPERFEAEGAGRVIYTDGSVDEGIDVVILATGYEHNFPFLPQVVSQPSPPTHQLPPPQIWNSGAHVYPLYSHIYPVCTSLPSNSIAFLGLPSHVVPFPLCEAQAVDVLRTFTLPPGETEEQIAWVRARDELLREKVGDGRAAWRHWHRVTDEAQFQYRDELVRRGGVEKWVTDAWLPDIYTKKAVLREEWNDAVRAGEGEALVKDARTKEDWYHVLVKLLQRAERRKADLAGQPRL